MEPKRHKDPNKTIRSKTIMSKLKKTPCECKVCAAPAYYSYVGIIVCFSCKMFFKRNAETKQVRL